MMKKKRKDGRRWDNYFEILYLTENRKFYGFENFWKIHGSNISLRIFSIRL